MIFDKKSSSKKRIINGIAFILLGLIMMSQWGVFNKCKQPLLLIRPNQVPSHITGIKQAFISTRQFSISSKIPIRWKRQANLPKLVGNITGSITDIGVQGTNIWLNRPGLLQKYSLKEDVLVDYLLTDEGEEITWVRYIHIMNNGTAWFLLRTETGYFLAKYDEAFDTLKIIQDQTELFSLWEYAEIDDFNYDSNMSETVSGELLIPYMNNIIAYQPDLNIAKFLLPESFDNEIRSIAESEGIVWFTVEDPKGLWSLNLLTNEMIGYGNEFGLDWHEDIPPIAVDGMERVWVGYKARLDPVGDGKYEWWKPEKIPLEFLILADHNLDTLSGNDAFWLEWSDAQVIKASSDGNVWFSTLSRVVNYDIYEDEWCLSATVGPSDLEEDDNGYLWFGIGHHYSRTNRGLYKFDLGLSEK